MTEVERLAKMYALRDRLDAEIAAAEALARKSPRRGKKRPRNIIPECGTESAYQRHRHYGTLPGPDDECGCRAGHAAHNREIERQRKLRRNRMVLGLVS